MDLVLNDEVLVAYGQNGEYLRPENGFPLRLIVPGVQGVSWVKWLRRIEVGDEPYGTRDETLHYIDPMPDGMHRQYTSLQEVKSVITVPPAVSDFMEQAIPRSPASLGLVAAKFNISMCLLMAEGTGIRLELQEKFCLNP